MQLKRFLKISLILAIISSSFGCSLLKPKVVTVTEVIEKKINVAERPKPVNLNDIKLYVVTEENFNDFKERFLSKNADFVFVAISIKDYENLSLNISELKRYILQQKNIILYYEESIKGKNKC